MPTLASVPSATATTGVPKSAKRSLPWWAPVSARKEPNGAADRRSCRRPGTRSGCSSAASRQEGFFAARLRASRSAWRGGGLGRRGGAWRSRSARATARRRGWPTADTSATTIRVPGGRARHVVGEHDRQARAAVVGGDRPAVERVGLLAVDRPRSPCRRRPARGSSRGTSRRRRCRREALHERGGDDAAEQFDVVGLGLRRRRELAGRGRRARRSRRRARCPSGSLAGTPREAPSLPEALIGATRPRSPEMHRRRRPRGGARLGPGGGGDDDQRRHRGQGCEDSNRHPKSVPDRTSAPTKLR